MAKFWAATAIGRPATTSKAPKRTQMPPIDVLAERLAAAPRPSLAAKSTTVKKKTSKKDTHTASVTAPVVETAGSSPWAFAPIPRLRGPTDFPAQDTSQPHSN